MNYVRCLHGAAAHLVFDEPDCFIVVDDRNRYWLCHPITEEQLDRFLGDEDVPDILAIHHAEHRMGIADAATSQALLRSNDLEELATRLAACP